MRTGGLCGAGVLVTRPAQLAEELVAAISAAGGLALPYPVIDIVPRAAAAVAIDAARLPAPDIVVFVSRNAVACGFDTLAHQAARIAAIGPATARALAARGRPADIVPAGGFDTEHLLAEPPLHDVAGRHVRIVRGDDGREMLATTLRERGATVDYLPVYRREPHHASARERSALARRWRDGGVHFITVLSVATFDNLLALLPAACLDALDVPLLVTPSDRVIQTALERMPQIRTLKAAGPGATEMVAAMTASSRSQTDDAHD